MCRKWKRLIFSLVRWQMLGQSALMFDNVKLQIMLDEHEASTLLDPSAGQIVEVTCVGSTSPGWAARRLRIRDKDRENRCMRLCYFWLEMQRDLALRSIGSLNNNLLRTNWTKIGDIYKLIKHHALGVEALACLGRWCRRTRHLKHMFKYLYEECRLDPNSGFAAATANTRETVLRPVAECHSTCQMANLYPGTPVASRNG